MNRPVALPLIALLVVGAGCVGAGPAATASDAPTASPTNSPTETGPTDTRAGTPTPQAGTVSETDVGTSPYDCPYHLDAEPATDSQRDRTNRTVAYENLTSARQSEFDRARNDTAELETLPDQWSSPVLVTYEGEEYYVVASTC